MKKFFIFIILFNTIIMAGVLIHKSSRKANRSETITTSFSSIKIDDLLKEPLQESLEKEDPKEIIKENFIITPVKRYRIAARLLRKEKYSYSQGHEVLPVDFALGWNDMSNLNTIKENKIEISQSNRFYFWRIPSFEKITRKQIEINSANVHISPFNKEIEKELEDINEKDFIYLEGYLVNVIDKSNGYRFISSLSREDTGAGACEVLLVMKVKKYE